MSATSVNQLSFEDGRCRQADGQAAKGPDCRMINLLAFLEEENKNLKRAVIDLALETLLLKSSLPSDKRKHGAASTVSVLISAKRPASDSREGG